MSRKIGHREQRRIRESILRGLKKEGSRPAVRKQPRPINWEALGFKGGNGISPEL